MVTYPVPKGAILDASENMLTAQALRGQLNFSRNWTNHRLTILTGAEVRQVKNEGSGSRVYGYDDAILTSVPVDYVTRFPTYIRGTKTTIPNGESFAATLNRYISYYGNLAYTTFLWKRNFLLHWGKYVPPRITISPDGLLIGIAEINAVRLATMTELYSSGRSTKPGMLSWEEICFLQKPMCFL
ncbi:hypothetical protein A8C56_21305 [Niabella ginsenosidivorans]|uniref:Uncharacterized protein n=1 Tax=Niabella ginsenosidivorans TaxID=1176587 RepID=A0A1A9I8Z6_9BACT|nr:hypothetical protein [Niabella ginsenosidivorans]ANH83180.1 hypothetical protein A8C56_21305 [Niabella ginsenosidivorans]